MAHEGSSNQSGIFITFEGGEGAGKTTHIRFLAEELRRRNYEVMCLREPGATDIGEQLRSVVLDPRNEAMASEAELFVYEAARAQMVSQVVIPALERGAVVLCDRFTDSTIAYQCYGRGLSREFVERANEFATQGIRPDRTIVMVTGGEAKRGLIRATRRGADRIEMAGEDFHTRVNDAFLDIAQSDSARVRIVASATQKSQTAQAVFSELEDLFPWMDGIASKSPTFFDRLNRSCSREAVAHASNGTADVSSTAQGV